MWIIFFISTFLLVIVMLNLLIAFISDVYNENVKFRENSFWYEKISLIHTIDQALSANRKKELHEKYS